jgi:hypothetical protein
LKQLKNLKISALKSDPKNARRRTERSAQQIKQSLEEFGAARSVVIDENNRLIAGHGTVEAAKALGIETIRVIETDGTELIAVQRSELTEEQKKRLAIADNRSSDLSDWDAEILAELGNEIDLTEFWDAEELDALLELDTELAEDDDEVVGDLVAAAEHGELEPRCQLGDIWQCGSHQLCVGDSVDKNQVTRLLGKTQIDIVLSDPPYGIKCQNKQGAIGAGKKYPIIANDDTTETAISAFDLCQSLFPDAVQIWWGANHYALPPSSCWLVWDKQNGDSFFADCELAWTNQKSAVRIFRHLWHGMVKGGIASGESRVHPNQKPVELLEWSWLKYAPDGATAFDPFLGSGTSMIAGERLGKAVVGFELMPVYAEVAIQRWERFTGKNAEQIG